jgi:hypothetical protein
MCASTEGTPVIDDSRERDYRFTGTIGKATIELPR